MASLESKEGLLLELRASANKYERELARAHGVTVGQLRRIEKSVDASSRRFESSFARTGTNLKSIISRSIIGPLTGIAGALSVRQVIGFADTFKRMTNALKVTGIEGDALGSTLETLFQIANKHSVPVEDLTTLYGRLAGAQKDLNISSAEMITFVDNVGAALRVSGKSTTEASGALLQLSQLLGGTMVQAEEWNSIIDGARPILEAVANGLLEAGGSVSKLTQIVKAGKLPVRAFFEAFMLGSGSLQQLASQSEKTVGQAWTGIQNAFIESIGSIDETTGASSLLTAEMANLASGIKATGRELEAIARFGGQVVDVFNRLTTLAPPAAEGLDVAGLRASIAAWDKLLAQAEARGEFDAAANMRARIAELQGEIRAAEGRLGPAWENLGRQGAASFAKGLRTVSLDDFIGGDLAATLDSILKDRRGEFSDLIGGGRSFGANRPFDRSSATAGFAQFPTPQFDVGAAAEQLQVFVRQREEIAALTSDLVKLESALQAHLKTPVSDVMGDPRNLQAARAELQRAAVDIDNLKARFLAGDLGAAELDRAIEDIRKRMEALAGEGDALDPFISGALKAISVLGSLRSKLNSTQSAVQQFGSGGRTTTVFTLN